MDVFVARQPIFDRSRQLEAYELLFRSEAGHNAFDGTESASATMQVMANSIFSIGLDDILCGKKAFLNFDRNLLMGGVHSMLPPDSVVLEILESVEPDAEFISACEQLCQHGYTIALDDFISLARFEPFAHVAKLIKVDLRQTSLIERQEMVRAFKPRGIAMLAEKVETHEEFHQASRTGFDLFQGYFFARPEIVRGRQIPASKTACLQLLNEIQRSDLHFPRLEKLISQDVSLCYKLLRYVNSPLFYRRTEVRSLTHALVVLGETGIRHWISLAALLVMANDKPGELVSHTLVRARFTESLAGLAGIQEPARAFLMGLLSLLDAFVDLPLEEALHQISVEPGIRAAILETAPEQDGLRKICRLVRSYECADWDGVNEVARDLGIKSAAVGSAYAAATLWVQQAMHATGRRTNTRSKIRYPAEGTVQILWEDGSERPRASSAQLLNVSSTGLRLQCESRIPADTAVSCNAPHLGILGTGTVRYCNFAKGKYLVGLEFSKGTGWREPAAPDQDSRPAGQSHVPVEQASH